MKKLLVVILVLLLCFSLVACVEDSSSDTNIGDTQTKELGLGSVAEFENLKFTAVEIKTSNGDEFFSPDDGNVFVGVKFVIENISSKEQTVSSLLCFEGYADDVKCSYSISASCVFEDGVDGSIAPGKKLEGWYTIEAPESWSEIEITVEEATFGTREQTFTFGRSDIGKAEVSNNSGNTDNDSYDVNDSEEDFKNLKFTALEYQVSSGNEWFKPADGNVFVGIKFLIENISSQEQTVSSLLYFEGYVDDIKCDYSFNASCVFDKTVDGSIAPGKKLEGWYSIEVPEDWEIIEIIVQEEILGSAKRTFTFENK